MWLNANKCLTKVNEGRHKQNRVRVQIADPDLIVKQQSLKIWMNCHPKSPLEKILKNDNLTSSGIRVTFPFGALQPSSSWLCSSPISTRSLRDLLVHRDFFHSLAIISTLFFESLLAIFCAESFELSLVGLVAMRRARAGGGKEANVGGNKGM